MSRTYHPRAFGLLFEVNQLGNPSSSHFIEGTIYHEPPAPGLNACGRAEVRGADGVITHEYETLSELATKLGLTQEAVNTLTSRISTLLS